MAEEGLMLNLAVNPPVSGTGRTKVQKQFRASAKWSKKAAKRKLQAGSDEGAPAKRGPAQARTPPGAPKPPQPRRAPLSPVKGRGGADSKRSPQDVPECGGQGDRPLVRTSSLFRNNPDIPAVSRPDVAQLREKVFTSDSFTDLELHPHLVSTLNNVLNVSSMTSVQKQTIPLLLTGRDVVVRSQTGSGKTLAYGIPLVQSLQGVHPKIKRSDGPLAVLVVPTRELAQQSFQIIQKLLKPFTWIVPGVLMGGEKRKSEKARLRKGINILISTPGRLVDHIKNTESIAFTAVRWLILDEADRTLDLGFEKDLTVILNALNAAGAQRQNVLLSATLTEGVSRLAGICLKEPVTVHASEGAAQSEEARELTSDPSSTGLSASFTVPEKLQQHMAIVPSKLRLVCLAAFILGKCKGEGAQKMIVFLSSCEAVEFLQSLFSKVLCGGAGSQGTGAERPLLDFMRLHGNMEQEERTEVFQKFSQSKTGILLCTDVAARGLDLPRVTWIVQYSPPASPAEYVHRVGRTARIGARGNSLLFLTPSETAYLAVLANHNISMSEMKMEDILANLMLDDRFAGRGKWDKKSPAALQQQVRVRATVLQSALESAVHSSAESTQAAKKALQSFLRAYTTYPAGLKHVFHIRTLHLGHTAKSFGLRDAPRGLGSGLGAGPRDRTRKPPRRTPQKLSGKERMANLLRSEYSSGMDTVDPKKKTKIHKKAGKLRLQNQPA
ncbi:ATP-dependent DNA helicase DDX31 isoform X2 [Lepisosteus oculatus]|uniref:ATP-dependent DNA helicase DDX31 isoform X2 n=1 Tax=Lepisosteus oculatus TaxID=7918 RepID=UPI00371FAE0D